MQKRFGPETNAYNARCYHERFMRDIAKGDLSEVSTPYLEALQMEIAAELQSRDVDGFQDVEKYYAGCE